MINLWIRSRANRKREAPVKLHERYQPADRND